MSKTLKQILTTVEEIFLLAEDIDNFMFNCDDCDYREEVDDTWLNIRNLAKNIVSGKTAGIKGFLRDIAVEEDGSDIGSEARELLQRLKQVESTVPKAG